MKRIVTVSIFMTLLVTVHNLAAQHFPVSENDGKYHNVNGSRIYTLSFGKGDPLFLIPGGPGGSHYGMRSFDSLSLHNTLVLFDGFGRGKSDTAKTPNEYSLQRDIDDLEGLRKTMGYETINVLGHSYGGVVAQGYAIQHPQHVKHLILANTFHSFIMWQANNDNSNHEIKTNYPEVWDTLMLLREQGFISSDAIHQKVYGRVPYSFMYTYNPENFLDRGKRSYPNNFNTQLYYQLVGKDGDFIVGSDIGNFDYRKQFKDLKMPILVIGGRYDRVAVPYMMVKYKDYCPQAQFELFEKSGHNPQVEEPTKEFNIINTFLAK